MTDLLPLSTAWSAGATVSTTADLLAFSGHLFTGSLLQPATRAAMLTCRPTRDPLFPGVQGYGAGVVCMTLGGETAYGHLGNIPGYSGLLAYLPRHDLHLAVLLNQDYFPVTPTSLNVQVLATAILEVVLA
jgi:D-alanyl-D-alanine carboxypeptidase